MSDVETVPHRGRYSCETILSTIALRRYHICHYTIKMKNKIHTKKTVFGLWRNTLVYLHLCRKSKFSKGLMDNRSWLSVLQMEVIRRQSDVWTCGWKCQVATGFLFIPLDFFLAFNCFMWHLFIFFFRSQTCIHQWRVWKETQICSFLNEHFNETYLSSD